MSTEGEDDSVLRKEDAVSEGLSNMEYVKTEMNTQEDTENSAFTDDIPQAVMEDNELSTTIDYTGGNTHVMTMEEMITPRYREFNKALTDLACLVDTYSADKKTIKYIKNEYLKVYMKYFDIVKYIYGLDIADETIVPGTSADRILFKREVVEPKRIKLSDGRKLHIYENKDGELQFIDETYINGTGITLQDLAYWVANRDKFTDNNIYCESLPATISIFGKTAFIPIKGLRIPRTGNIMEERFYSILGRLYKQIGDMITERKKALSKKGITHCSDDELMDDDDDN